MTGPTLFQSNPRHSVQVGPPSIFVEAGSGVAEKVGVSPGRTSSLLLNFFCILAEFSLKAWNMLWKHKIYLQFLPLFS